MNGDGRLDALVYIFGEWICGSSGCGASVFQYVNDHYRLISDIGLARNPIIVSQHKSHGWNDLILFVAGGGILPGYFAVLQFNGDKYPENPSVAPAVPLTIPMKGTAFVVGSGEPNSDLILYPVGKNDNAISK